MTDTDSVSITVNAQNDPPAGTDNTFSTAEDTAYTFTAADLGSPIRMTLRRTAASVKITTLPGLGTLTNTTSRSTLETSFHRHINGGLLKFRALPMAHGSPYTTFTFQCRTTVAARISIRREHHDHQR